MTHPYNPRRFNQDLVNRESWRDWARKDWSVREELRRRGEEEPSLIKRIWARWFQTNWLP